MAWKIEISKKAIKDAHRLKSAGLEDRAKELLAKIAVDPFAPGDGFEKLVGDLAGLYSRRIDYHNRIVYQVNKPDHVVRVLRCGGHY